MIPECIHHAIENGRKFIISTHINPDADGMGASVALCWLLWKLGRRAYIVNTEKLPEKFRFLENLFPVAPSIGPDMADADTWMILDASRFSRTGLPLPEKGRTVVNIDHHADNERFGACHWVDADAPAVSEMIYWLIRESGYIPDREIAEALYTGILIDTGGFKFSNTDTRVFQVCAELAGCGIDCQGLYKTVFLDKSVNRLKLEGEIMRNAELHFNNRVCVMEVTEETFEKTGTDPTDLEGISNLPMQIKDVEVGVIFIRKDGKTKVCLRSNGSLNVGEVASLYGGGGHAAAAGCTLGQPAATAREMIFSRLSEHFK